MPPLLAPAEDPVPLDGSDEPDDVLTVLDPFAPEDEPTALEVFVLELRVPLEPPPLDEAPVPPSPTVLVPPSCWVWAPPLSRVSSVPGVVRPQPPQPPRDATKIPPTNSPLQRPPKSMRMPCSKVESPPPPSRREKGRCRQRDLGLYGWRGQRATRTVAYNAAHGGVGSLRCDWGFSVR